MPSPEQNKNNYTDNRKITTNQYVTKTDVEGDKNSGKFQGADTVAEGGAVIAGDAAVLEGASLVVEGGTGLLESARQLIAG